MSNTSPTHRQCVDCYYRIKNRCQYHDNAGVDCNGNDACEFFIRTSLRFAFFSKMQGYSDQP